MKIFQQQLQLKTKRGFHLITTDILNAIPNLNEIKTGICHVFIQHTSASLTINENADPLVRKDFENWFNKLIPDGDANFLHTSEGPEDMPAHLKSSLLDTSVMIPISNGKLTLGMWQGVYLCEHRNNINERNLIITAWGV